MQICGKEALKIYMIELACSNDAPGLHTSEDPRQVVHLPDEEQ